MPVAKIKIIGSLLVLRPGEKIIHAKHIATVRDQAATEMRTQKAGTAGDKNTFAQGVAHE